MIRTVSAPLTPGEILDDRYRILSVIGEGGMGAVYEAEHLILEKRVAIKVIHAELLSDRETRERFEREARITAQIEHPHVTTAMDAGRLPSGAAYLVVQLLRGISLADRIQAGAMEWRTACTIGAQIADALVAIHEAGFVHRDLTPSNVVISERDDGTPHVHVLDLGVALALGALESRITGEGHIVGTNGYMAPEQALGHTVDARADLYTLGVLLWEMCAGRRLYPQEHLVDIVADQLAGSVPPLPPSEAPQDLERTIQWLLTAERDRRPSSAAELRQRLRRLSQHEDLGGMVRRLLTR